MVKAALTKKSKEPQISLLLSFSSAGTPPTAALALSVSNIGLRLRFRP